MESKSVKLNDTLVGLEWNNKVTIFYQWVLNLSLIVQQCAVQHRFRTQLKVYMMKTKHLNSNELVT